MSNPLTQNMAEKTRALLEYIIDFYAKHHYGPTFREAVADLGWSTTSLVDHHVTQLERRGLVERVPNHPRSLKPTQVALGALA